MNCTNCNGYCENWCNACRDSCDLCTCNNQPERLNPEGINEKEIMDFWLSDPRKIFFDACDSLNSANK